MTPGPGPARPRAHRSHRALALTAATLFLSLATPALAGSGDPDPRLRALGDEFVDWRRARAPRGVSRGGVPAAGPLAGKVSASALAGELGWLRQFRIRLSAVPADTGFGEAAIDRALIEAAVEQDLVELEVLRPYQRDPGAYLSLLAGSIEAALDAQGSSTCLRLQRCARRLTEAPEILRAARLNLRDPPRVLTELAIERGAAVLRFLREDVPRLTAGCRNSRMQADLAQADTTAVRAIQAYVSYLEQDLLPDARGEPAIGPEGCRRLLRASLAAEVASIDTLLAEATLLVRLRRAELDSLAAGVTGAGTRAALDSLADARLDGAGWNGVMARAVDRVTAFLAGGRIVTLPARPAPKLRDARRLRAPGTLTLSHAGAGRDPRAGRSWLEFAPPASRPEADGGPPRLGRFNPREADLMVAHEGLPGRHLRALAVRGGPARARRQLLEAWSGEDWGQYCEQMMIDEGFGAGDRWTRLSGAVRALRHASRALAALALHAGVMTQDEARALLEERGLFDASEAGLVARQVAAEPALMGYTAGAQRLRELQDEARRRLGPRFRTRTFNDAVLRCGASPHGIVRDRLWHELADATDDSPVGAGP